ncbi:MAG: type I restriction endonuclease [Methylococcaceae bacterium]
MTTKENQIEQDLIDKLTDLKYTYREDIRDREALEQNFREKFETLNRVHLTDSEFARLRDEIVNADVFTAAKTLRERNTFQREDGTPLQYTLVNIKDWCKNEFEVINQLRINIDNSHHRYDVILLINGVPVVQIELKSLDVTPPAALWSKLSNTKTTPAMAIPIRCCALCSCLSLAMKTIHATLPTIITSILALTPTSNFYRFMYSPAKTTKKSTIYTNLPSTFSPNAH